MTWERTAEARSDAGPGRVWAVLLDGRRWSLWNPGVAWMAVEDELAPGRLVTIKPRRGPQTAFRIERAIPQRELALLVTFGPVASLRLRWELQPAGAGTRIVQTIAIAGPLAGPLLRRAAERIAAGAPAVLEALAERAAAVP